MSSDPSPDPKPQPKIVVKGQIEAPEPAPGKKGRHAMVAGIFDDPGKVGDALRRLGEEGYPRESISVLASRETHGKHFEVVERTKAPEGAALGGLAGAILGAVLLSVVSSSLALLDVSVYWQDIIRGSILLAAVSIDHYLVKKRA